MNSDAKQQAARVSILLATPGHVATISQLHNQLFDTGWSEQAIRELNNDRSCSTLVATDQRPDNVVGFIIGRLVADEGEILSLGVAEPYQKLGIGRRLVAATAVIMERSAVSNLYLEVAADNAAAIALYRGCGFKEAGLRKNYYKRPNGEFCDAQQLTCTPGTCISSVVQN